MKKLITLLILISIIILALAYTAWASASTPLDDCEDSIIMPMDDDDCRPTKTPKPTDDDDDDDKKPTKTPTPTITLQPTQPVINGEARVVNVWTADGEWLPKVNFLPGEPIQWIMDIYSTVPDLTDVTITYQVIGENGESILYQTFVVTTGEGLWSWGLPGEVLRVYGKHIFIGYSVYNNLSASKITTYQVDEGFVGTNKYYMPFVIMDWRMQPNPITGGVELATPTFAPTIKAVPTYIRATPTFAPTSAFGTTPRITPTYAPTWNLTQMPLP